MPEKMKIGFFTTTYYPTPDGVSHYLRDVKHELEQRGHEVHVFSFNGDRNERNVHIPATVPFPVYPQYNMPVNPFPMYLYKLARKIGFDVIHIHDPFMGSIGYRLAKAAKIPIIATFHTDFVRMQESLKMPFKNTLFRLSWRYNSYLYRKCDLVLVPSLKTMEYLKENGIENTEELPLFVDTWKYNSCEKSFHPFIVQYLGRITRDKGVFRILDVAQAVGKSDEIRFIISGTGPDADNLVREAEKKGLMNMITFTGYVDEKKKIDLLSSANLFIYPSDTDTFGISVLEAMSSGLPAIIPEGFPLIHYDGNDDSGLIVSDFSRPETIARRIEELRKDPERLATLNTAARSFAVDNFSKQKHCDRLISIYEHFMGSNKNPGKEVTHKKRQPQQI